MNRLLKWGLVAVVVVVIGSVAKESMKASKEVDAKIAFESSCKSQAQKSASIPSDRVDAVCACVIDKTVESLGNDGFARLATVKNATDMDRQVLMDSMALCMEQHLPPN